MRLVLASDNAGKAPAGWGSHVQLTWRDWEPEEGRWNYGKIDWALSQAERPCYLQIAFSLYDKAKRAPADLTPAHHRRSLALTAASGVTGTVPDYSPMWTEAYIAAIEKLAEHYRDDARVAGYWHAAGWGNETHAAANNSGGAWADLLRPRLKLSAYLNSLTDATLAAIAAWDGKPVYLPAAPSPGALWGYPNRETVAELLRAGASYMNCGLGLDSDKAVGLGERAGLGMYEMAWAGPKCGFEEGPRLAKDEPLEVYWMLLHALQWDADFVNLYGTISAPQAEQVAGYLPAPDTRWLVFRDAEYPISQFVGADGLVYGWSGERGQWGRGLEWRGGGALVFDKQRYDWGRWVLVADEPVQLTAPGLADGPHWAKCWLDDGTPWMLLCEVAGERLTLPAGRYHRVDLAEPVVVPEPNPEPLTLEARVALLEERVTALEAG